MRRLWNAHPRSLQGAKSITTASAGALTAVNKVLIDWGVEPMQTACAESGLHRMRSVHSCPDRRRRPPLRSCRSIAKHPACSCVSDARIRASADSRTRRRRPGWPESDHGIGRSPAGAGLRDRAKHGSAKPGSLYQNGLFLQLLHNNAAEQHYWYRAKRWQKKRNPGGLR